MLTAKRSYISSDLFSDVGNTSESVTVEDILIMMEIVEKTFNNGNGSLALFRLLPKEKKIKVNSSLATKSDFQKLADLQKYLGINFEVIKYNYYYPEYYNHSF